MGKLDRLLAEQRAARDEARAELGRLLDHAKRDLAPATLGRRLMSEVRHAVALAATTAGEAANDNRGLLGAVAAAALVWLARKPLFSGLTALAGRYRAPRRPAGNLRALGARLWQKLKDYADD